MQPYQQQQQPYNPTGAPAQSAEFGGRQQQQGLAYQAPAYGGKPVSGQGERPSVPASTGAGLQPAFTAQPSEIQARKDPFALLTEDHNIFRQLISMWRYCPPGNIEEKKAIIAEITAAIVSHASVEEQHVHELYRKHLPAGLGQQYFNDSLWADQENKNALWQLENLNWTYPGAEQRADSFMNVVIKTEDQHMPAEEQSYFPALAAALNEQQKGLLYDQLVYSKQWAPVHAHPSAPDQPTWARLTHPIAGFVDRARDMLMGRSTPPTALPHPHVSQGLTGYGATQQGPGSAIGSGGGGGSMMAGQQPPQYQYQQGSSGKMLPPDAAGQQQPGGVGRVIGPNLPQAF